MFCCSSKPATKQRGASQTPSMTQSAYISPTAKLASKAQDNNEYYQPNHKPSVKRFSIFDDEIALEESLIIPNPGIIKKLIFSSLNSTVNSTNVSQYVSKRPSVQGPIKATEIESIQPEFQSPTVIVKTGSNRHRRSVSQAVEVTQQIVPDIEEAKSDDKEEEDDEQELSEEEAKKAALFRWAKETHNYSKDKDYDAIQRTVSQYKPWKSTDQCRTPAANKGGGKQCKDKKLVKTIRAIGKQIIREVGKKVLSGSFNLTTISFPIRAMIPKSALEKALEATSLFPLYMNKAASTSDLVERMKYVICATIGNFYINCSFLKPLNPILGETIEAKYKDNTKLYAEQISHHPPISYFLVINPKYQFYGYYNYDAKAGLNSLSLKNSGKRTLKFFDGQVIEYNFGSEEYSGSFWSDMKVEVLGKLTFNDMKNKIKAEFSFDNVRWKPSDYFSGDIKVNGKSVSKIMGSYMGFLEFDGMRYWDFTAINPYQLEVVAVNQMIQSDHSFRMDKALLLSGKLDEAQQNKDKLEQNQRLDAQLRKPKKK